MSDVYIIGSNPSIKSATVTPFWKDTKSFKVLNSWLQEADIECESMTFLNVSNAITPNNRPLKKKEILENIYRLDLDIQRSGRNNKKIIALGKTAEIALTLLGYDFYAMPHPSGLNRVLNDKEYVKQKIKLLKEYLKK